jgi:nucleoside-diphosphate-sugar epimerase
MKILIAGGAGLIGSNLSKRLLNDGNEIICVDNLLSGKETNIDELKTNPSFQFINHDVTLPLHEDITAEAVFHLASPASPNHHSDISYHALPMETMMVNTKGTLELLKFAEKNNAKFLFASTSEVYGDPQVNPQREEYRGNTSTTGPRAVYDEAKRFGETLVSYFWREKDLDARIARIFNTYGPGMQKNDLRMIEVFILQALRGEPITIFGDGLQTRSLCFIDDLVEGLVRLMFYENTKKEIVNLGNPEEHTVLDYAKMVKELTISQSEIIFSESLPQDDPMMRCPDISKAKELLNWEPKTTLTDGLLKMIEYMKSQS